MSQGCVGALVGSVLLVALALACGEDNVGQSGDQPCAAATPSPCACSSGYRGTLLCENGVATGCFCQAVGAADGAVGDPGLTAGAGSSAGVGGTSAGVGGTGALPGGGALPGAGPVDAGAAPMDGGMPGGSAPGDGGVAVVGSKDGDPAKPIVAVEGVACRQQSAGGAAGGIFGGGAGLSSANAMVGGRELIVDYPCGKHEGAQMTVILNLHGTLIQGASWTYQRGYFSAYRFVSSHNLIVVHPRSVSTAPAGAQWGNMDNGQDEPHLLAVVEWVYSTFSKFQLRGLWVGGHSWGAMYATGGRLGAGGFVCHSAFQDKAKGAIGMSGAGVPACASRVSLISTRGGLETSIGLLDQSRAAMGHGCDAAMKGPELVGNNERRYFDGCDPGWVHDDYLMTGKGHTDFMDQEVVKKILDTIKATEI
jgi:hypothetical protein